MKILLINAVCGIGSTGKICADLAEYLEKCGNEVKIAYGRYSYVPEKYQKYAVQIGTPFSIKINALKARLFDNEGLNAKKATKSFLRWADDFNPDLLWIHNLHGYYINYELLFRWIKTRPQMQVRWTLHDCWAFTGHCSHFTMAKCDKWKTGCSNCPQHEEYPKSFFDRSKKMYELKKKSFTGVQNLTIITPSQWLSDLVKQSFLKEYPVKVINNGIDLSVFKPTESNFKERYSISKDKYILLGVAFDWGPRKGLDVFIELSKCLPDEFQIVLVGTNTRIDKLLPSNIISIHRTKNPAELAEIYTASDLFVNPTREDNFPTVNLESLACGTPVLTYKTGGSPECLNETCGSVVECDDIDALEREIKRICISRPYSREACILRAKAFDKNK